MDDDYNDFGEDVAENFDFDDYEYQEDPEFRDEIKAFERVGTIVIKRHLEVLAGESKRIILQNPKNRFFLYLDASFRNINDLTGFGLTENDLQIIVDATEKIEHFEHLNPNIFIISYVLTKKRVTPPTNEEFEAIFKAGSNVDAYLEKPDFLRYVRLWLRVNNE